MPRIPDPDMVRRLQQQAADQFAFFGHDATLRKYISASGAQPEVGLGDSWRYQARPVQIDFRPLRMDELATLGGQGINEAHRVAMPQEPGPRDEIVYDGKTYRIVSPINHEHIGGVLFWTFVMARGEVTGTW